MTEEQIDLKALPRDHPLRNKPLGEIFACYKHVDAKTWRSVVGIKISKNTFNQLGEVWLANDWSIQQSK